MAKRCWIAEKDPGARGECRGRLQRAHLLPQRVLKREIGVLGVPCPTCQAAPGLACRSMLTGRVNRRVHVDRSVALLWDKTSWQWMCEAHHHALDHARTLRIPREWIPRELFEWAASLEAGQRGEPLTCWLDREYGERQEAA